MIELLMTADYSITEKHPVFKCVDNPDGLSCSVCYGFTETYWNNDCLANAIGDMLRVISCGYQINREWFKDLEIRCNGNIVWQLHGKEMRCKV